MSVVGSLLLTLLLAVGVAPASRAQVPCSAFEIVESVPLEAELENPDVRNTQEVWLEMIRSATSTLDIAQFYVADETGRPLEPVIAAIVQAARRGVAVRILGDATFYKTYPDTLDRLKREPNTEVRCVDFRRVRPGAVHHAKYFVVDGSDLYIGSANFDWRAMDHIREIGLRIRHRGAAAEVERLFQLDWQLSAGGDPKAILAALPGRAEASFAVRCSSQERPIRFWPVWSPRGFTPDDGLWELPAILRAIGLARERLSVEVMTYEAASRQGQAWMELRDALIAAAGRGVQVRMMVADWGNRPPKIDYVKGLSQVQNLTVKILSVPDHSSGFIPFARVTHCKYMTVDDEVAWVGSSNWEKDYFYESRDLGVLVESPAVAQRLRRIFEQAWESRYATVVRPDGNYPWRKYTP